MRFSPRPVALAVFALAFAAPAALRAQLAVQSPVPSITAATPADPMAPVAPVADRRIDRDSSSTTYDMMSPPSSGAPMTGLRAGVHAKESTTTLQPTLAPSHANIGQSRAMMVVGVAGLIVGAIIGGSPGTIIMVGGAVVGLVGLYDYLQ